MAVDLAKLKAVATSGPPDSLRVVTCGYLLMLEEEIRVSRREKAFSPRVADLTHMPEILRS